MPETVTVRELADVLHEPRSVLLARIVRVLGPERCVVILVDALTIESNGGMLTSAGDRRRTPGGVFLALVRAQATDEERHAIFRRGARGAETP